MPVSSRSSYTWRCSHCDEVQSAPIWRLLDARERPDVLAELAPGLASVVCPVCAAQAPIEAPLLLIRPGAPLSLLLAVSLEELNGIVVSSAPELSDEARVALRRTQRRLPAPMIPIPRLILPLALTRDVAQDLADPGATYDGLHASQPAATDLYLSFLDVVRSSEPERRIARILAELWSIDSAQLVEYLDSHPELASPIALSYGAADVAAESNSKWEGPLHIRQRLLESLRSGMQTSEVVRAYVADIKAFVRQLQEEVNHLRNQAAEKPDPEGIRLLYNALDIVAPGLDPALEAELCIQLGGRLAADRAAGVDAIEEAIRLFSRALALISEDRPEWARTAGNLAYAYSQRTVGDRKQNWNNAHELLQRASLVDRNTNPRTWAIIQTNLGLLFADRPDRSADDLNRGIEHIRAGMQERSPADNVTDWAYSLVNLGVLYQRRGGAADLRLARNGYHQALEHLGPDDDLPLWSTIQHNLADALLSSEPPDLDGAEAAARAALVHVRGRGEGYGEARLTWVLAKVAHQRSGNSAADGLELRAEALLLAKRELFPTLHLRIASEQAGKYAELGNWQAAAGAFSSAITALDMLYDAQASPESRRDMLSLAPNLSRWAAFAMAHAGRPEQAVETLEHGQARELALAVGRDTADLTRLAAIDSLLVENYRSLQKSYRNALAGGARPTDQTNIKKIEAAEQALQNCIDEIRFIPGFDQFLRPITFADISQIANDLPLVYLVSSPAGSYALAVSQDQLGTPVVESTFVPTVTSMTVYGVVMFEHRGEPAPGLLLAQSSNVLLRQQLLSTALQRLELLQPLINPVAQLVARHPSRASVIVPTGLLGLVPLHAVPLDQAETVLDNLGDTYITPSATLFAASRSRAQNAHDIHLVAIADPDGSLPGSRAEVAAIRTYFAPDGESIVEQGANATYTWLMSQLPMASHLHLSCHGNSDFAGPGGTLQLGSGSNLTVDAMLNGALPMCRLAVASACQSGHYSLSSIPSEFTGLPAAFLQAGAACAIVSLWQVDDWATALLMTRFYELLAPTRPEQGMHPAPALRQARQWLRLLTNRQVADYIDAHPHLAGIQLATSSPTGAGDTPYASSRHWSAFMSWGY